MRGLHSHHRVLKEHKWRLMGLPNVVGVGLGNKMTRGEDTGQEALVVFVSNKLPEHTLPRTHQVPKLVNGIPTDVVYVGDIRLLDDYPEVPAEETNTGEEAEAVPLETRTGRQRPAYPGVSIGHYRISAGTLGAVVYDNKTGDPLILSNNHVLANRSNGRDGRARIGDPILQPGSYDGGSIDSDRIGSLFRYMPITYGYTKSAVKKDVGILAAPYSRFIFGLPVYRQSNLIDAALAKPLNPESVSPEIMGIGKCTGTAEAYTGMMLRKSGRTSGITEGRVMYTGSSLRVRLSDEYSAVFDDQIVLGPVSEGGDSGSVLLSYDNKAVGLLFAGSDEITVANDINHVVRLLRVKFEKQEG